MTQEEWDTLKEEADNAGYCPAAYAYYKVVDKPIRVINPQFSADVRSMLAISRNLNQIAAACNTLHYLPSGLAIELKKALDLINSSLEYAYKEDYEI